MKSYYLVLSFTSPCAGLELEPSQGTGIRNGTGTTKRTGTKNDQDRDRDQLLNYNDL